MTNKLSAMQQRFADGILSGLNQRDAYVAAGYKCKNDETARANSARLITNANVTAYIEEHRQKASQTAQVTQERILQEYARIGFSDLRRALTPDGSLGNPNDWDDDTAAAISSLEVVTRSTGDDAQPVEYINKIKTWDKTKALDAMARHLGMFDGHKGNDDPADEPVEMDKRAAARMVAHMLLRAAGPAQLQPE